MKKTAAATKSKAAKTPATAPPAEEGATVAAHPAKVKRPARKAKAAKPTAKNAAEVISKAGLEKRKAGSKVAAPKQAGSTKKDQVLALISRAKGASLDEIMVAMGWQRHTVRGFVSLLGKAGTTIESFKNDKGLRSYKAA